jgi:hypothetical protein
MKIVEARFPTRILPEALDESTRFASRWLSQALSTLWP